MLRKSSFKLIALSVISLVLISGCSKSEKTSTASDAAATDKGRVCVILPDSASSPIWENVHRPVLNEGFTAAGYTTDIQNANGDTNKFATIGAQMLSSGCKLMLIVDLEGAGIQVATKAKAQGIPVIALDRPMLEADYFVSYDNFKIGDIQCQSVVDALIEQGKDVSK
ncbi:MAG: substrate-binding domain-containing protein, partial [Actinobacteria bacterium]|nr:substrate-binding domain-containing protein [Actinomycetota bacterium]